MTYLTDAFYWPPLHGRWYFCCCCSLDADVVSRLLILVVSADNVIAVLTVVSVVVPVMLFPYVDAAAGCYYCCMTIEVADLSCCV